MALRVAEIIEVLGGRRTLGRRVANAAGLRESADAGLPFRALEAAALRFRLDRREIARTLRLPERTLARRKRDRKLRPDESDRLLRLARVGGEAARVLGSDEKAALWLKRPNAGLGGEVPLDLLATDIGARQVEEVLGRIEYGVYG